MTTILLLVTARVVMVIFHHRNTWAQQPGATTMGTGWD